MSKRKSVDITDRLRAVIRCEPGCYGRCRDCPLEVAGDAIAEIERLRSELHAARHPDPSPTPLDAADAYARARGEAWEDTEGVVHYPGGYESRGTLGAYLKR